MKYQEIFLFIIVMIASSFICDFYASAENITAAVNSSNTLSGKITDIQGKAISNAIITISTASDNIETSRKTISANDGSFELEGLEPGYYTIRFEANGFDMLEENGVYISGVARRNITLRREWISWASLVLLIPGILGLFVASINEEKVGDEDPESCNKKVEKKGYGPVRDNRFWVAFFNAAIWAGTLALVKVMTGSSSEELCFLYQGLSFELYIPILGFIGALLYVLDLCRRGREDIPRGTEFGMRLIMGPYVAIVMVLLFGNNLGFVDFTSPAARATLAFFSGLLVVVALQGLIERGNETLGRWRRNSRYMPSDIAKKFDLNEDEDLKLRKAGFTHLSQIRDCEEDELRKEVKKAGFDEILAVDFKIQLMDQKRLKDLLGDIALSRLEKIGVKTIKGFSLLSDASLEKIAEQEPQLASESLISLRNQSKEEVSPNDK